MKVVVTGASGFLGNNLVRLLVAQGVRPSCIKRPGSAMEVLADCPVDWIDNAYQDFELLKKIIAGADVTYHCAAQVGTANKVTQLMLDSNVALTKSIVAACMENPSGRLVYCSTVATCAVAENDDDVSEDDEWNLDKHGIANGYAITKRMAEKLVIEAVSEGLNAVIVNPCYMFGPVDSKPSSCRLILDVCKGAIPGYPSGVNNFVDVRDVARGMILAAKKGRKGERYILGGENLSYKEVFGKITSIANSKPVSRPLPGVLSKFIGLLGDLQEKISGKESLLNSSGVAWASANCRYSSAKATLELGYSASGVDDAIKDAYEWFLQHNYL